MTFIFAVRQRTDVGKNMLHIHTLHPAVSWSVHQSVFCNAVLITVKKVKVNQSRYRPGVVQRVPGG